MSIASFVHVTLNSAHSSTSVPLDVPHRDAKRLAQLIARATRARNIVALPQLGREYAIAVTVSGTEMLATVFYTVDGRHVPVVTMGVAQDVEFGATLWDLMHVYSEMPLMTAAAAAPKTPWVAARLELGAMLFVGPHGLARLARFEQALAWGFVQYVAERADAAEETPAAA